MMNSPYFLGIGGGSGSGKTTFSLLLQKKLGKAHCNILPQDSYYLPRTYILNQKSSEINFDHPQSLDFSLMEAHLKELSLNKSISIPIYDFSTHNRTNQTKKLTPKSIILVEGNLIFSQEKIRKFFNCSLYIQAHEKICYKRRLLRDCQFRGRKEEDVKRQFYEQVKPMHDLYVKPFASSCDTIISGEKNFTEKINKLASFLKQEISKKNLSQKRITLTKSQKLNLQT